MPKEPELGIYNYGARKIQPFRRIFRTKTLPCHSAQGYVLYLGAIHAPLLVECC